MLGKGGVRGQGPERLRAVPAAQRMKNDGNTGLARMAHPHSYDRSMLYKKKKKTWGEKEEARSDLAIPFDLKANVI